MKIILKPKKAKGAILKSMNTLRKDYYVFSQSKEDIFFGKYLNVIIAGGWFVLLVFECIWGVDFPILKVRWPIVSIFVALPLFLITGLLFYLSSHKFAYRVEFDFQKMVVKFCMFRRKKTIMLDISDLEVVKINWHTHFIFKNGKTIKYKANDDFFVFLKEHNIPRQWGKFGRLFLKREYRAKFEQEL